MWKRASKLFCCPLCEDSLDLKILKAENREPVSEAMDLAQRRGDELNARECYVVEGLFTCDTCKTWYPIHRGIPVFLLYVSPLRREFLHLHGQDIFKSLNGYSSPSQAPTPGEEFVMKSFSKEWLEYKYDGTLWTWSYEDRQKLLGCELGKPMLNGKSKIIDVGCGIGLTTSFAGKLYNSEAVGIDLSLAVLQASVRFGHNPFLHFVQCSVFAIPFPEKSFDYVYSHGVLHHTYSTKRAFLNVAKLCKSGGITYLWVYGLGSIHDSKVRKIAYGLELLMRPVVNRLPSALSTSLLMSIAPLYLIANRSIRKANPNIAKYNFRRAMHAARDRFTPAYAHRHTPDEVRDWFTQAGFVKLLQIREQDVPLSARPDFKMNIGIRGVRSQSH